jgi:hypothetical protein
MRRSKPPALATWLLEHARSSTTDSVIAGDLQEGFNQGRSAGWYWRQVLLAIAAGYASEVRAHKVRQTGYSSGQTLFPQGAAGSRQSGTAGH